MRNLFIFFLLASFNSFANFDQLWSDYTKGYLSELELAQGVESINEQGLTSIQKLKLAAMKSALYKLEKQQAIAIKSFSNQEALEFISARNMMNNINFDLSKSAAKTVDEVEKKLLEVTNSSKYLTENEVLEVLDYNHSSTYRNSKYDGSITLYLLCRQSRAYPCRFVLKDIHGRFVRSSNGKVWSMPALAKSKRDLAYYQTNGQTPTGVHTIDSVMPSANRHTAFGKFRRMILNWVVSGSDEKWTKSFLPPTHRKFKWWKRASVARDAGRKYLRIHGTGKLNNDPKSSFYPHVPTSGCVSTLEGTYDFATFIGQRILLDKIMRASFLSPVYANETKISGVLYVMNLGDERRAVTQADIDRLNI